MSQQNTKICTFFNTSKGCNKGDSCYYLHDNKSSDTQPQQKFSYQSQRVAQHQQRIVYQPKQQRQQNFQNHPSNYRTVMCRYLTEPDGCKYGDKCKFFHSEKTMLSQENQSEKEPDSNKKENV